MSRTEDIDNALWNESDFYALSPPAKLAYIWSWTNQRCGFSGIYQVPLAAISFETRLSEDEVKDALVELEQASFVFYDGQWLWCKARVKHIKTRTLQMCKAVAKDIARVPELHPYRLQLLELQGGSVWQSGEFRTTIRETLGTLKGGTPDGSPEGQGSHTPNRATEPNGVTHPNSTTDPHASGKGPGIGKGSFERKNGLSRSRARGDASRPPYSPDPEAVFLRDSHFPDQPVEAVESCATTLRFRRQEVTVEAIRVLLYGGTDKGEEAA